MTQREIDKRTGLKGRTRTFMTPVSESKFSGDSEEFNDDWRKEIYDKLAKVKWDVAADHSPYLARRSSQSASLIEKRKQQREAS